MNTYLYICIFVAFVFTIVFVLSVKKSYEGFGYDSDPLQFREPTVYPNFITKDQANYILEMAEYNYKDSIVVGSNNPEGIRKSQTYWLKKDDPVAQKIIKKVCSIDGHSIEQAEDIQIVKYEPSGYYNEHHDSCCDNLDECKEFVKDGNRIVTMVIYLNDEFEGGATRFPKLNKNFKPKKYSGILFYPMNKNGDKCHEKSLHAGMPITKGEKYIANVWLRDKK
jgi:prolyl 4-hydroxylase